MSTPLKPFRIGNVAIDLPVVLAPLAGYSDLPFRRLCRQLGAPYCATEVMLDKSLLVGVKLRNRLAATEASDHPVGGQIMGSDPSTMAEAAACIAERGFDVIDLNFACPVRKALRRRRGGWLMNDPALAEQIIRTVAAVIDRPLTVKLRMSFDATDRTRAAFWRIAESAFSAGAAGICVHARSVEQKYTGSADWNFLAAVAERFADRVVVGSGDVLTPADALAMLERTGVTAVAAARGALGNPWFFRQVRDLASGREPYRPPLTEQREVIERHFRWACDFYGPRRGPKIMRKFGIKYARSHPHPRDIRMAFVNVHTTDDWQAVLDQHYPAPAGCETATAASVKGNA